MDIKVNDVAKTQQVETKQAEKPHDDSFKFTLISNIEEKDLQEKLSQAQENYKSLKMAKMLEVTDTDVEGAQKRIAKLIREVNKCITLLSEK